MELGALLSFLAALGFGTGQVLIRGGTQHLPVSMVAFIAVITATTFNLSVALGTELHEIGGLSLGTLGWLTFMGATAVVGGRLLNFNAISMVGAARAAPFSSSSPIFAAVLAIALLGERPGLLVGLGTPVAVGGLVLVAWGGARGRAGSIGPRPRMLGYFLAVGAAIAFASVNVTGRHVVSDLASPRVASGVSLFIGLGFLSALAGRDVVKALPRLSLWPVSLCIGAGLLQGLAQLSLLEALSRAPVMVVTPIYASSPVITLVLAYLFLRRLEGANLFVLSGVLFTLGGVVMVLAGMEA